MLANSSRQLPGQPGVQNQRKTKYSPTMRLLNPQSKYTQAHVHLYIVHRRTLGSLLAHSLVQSWAYNVLESMQPHTWAMQAEEVPLARFGKRIQGNQEAVSKLSCPVRNLIATTRQVRRCHRLLWKVTCLLQSGLSLARCVHHDPSSATKHLL